MTEKEMKEINEVFYAGYILEEKLIENGYCTEEGCVGTSSCINDVHFARAMDFEYTEKKPTQEVINTFAPKGFRFILDFYEHEDNEDSYYNTVFCVEVSKE